MSISDDVIWFAIFAGGLIWVGYNMYEKRNEREDSGGGDEAARAVTPTAVRTVVVAMAAVVAVAEIECALSFFSPRLF